MLGGGYGFPTPKGNTNPNTNVIHVGSVRREAP
jgi:hypothetical protein